MAVLKHTSPTAWPVAPKPKPSSTVPSASTSRAVALGSVQALLALVEASLGCVSVIESLNLGPARRLAWEWGANHLGVPPALPGRQQKFDISGGRPPPLHRRNSES